MPKVIIGVGSNLGDRVYNCIIALKEISAFAKIVTVSSAYETEPVGNEDQPDFINCAAEIETALPPLDLLKRVREVEEKLGRVRDTRWGQRTIDIDIIFYDDLTLDTADLKLPHPQAHLRRFVLEPVSEITPGKIHPGYGVTVRELCENLGDGKSVKKVGAPSTLFPR
jgi:2-amino-4-hydroxy-6-hydroxymethyldihydropteridine diphosphokinase